MPDKNCRSSVIKQHLCGAFNDRFHITWDYGKWREKCNLLLAISIEMHLLLNGKSTCDWLDVCAIQCGKQSASRIVRESESIKSAFFIVDVYHDCDECGNGIAPSRLHQADASISRQIVLVDLRIMRTSSITFSLDRLVVSFICDSGVRFSHD